MSDAQPLKQMQRNEVYRLIDGEREYQQAQGKPDKRTLNDWLDSIQYYFENATSADYIEDVTEELRKVAALAVAALEQYGCQPREGYDSQPAAQPSTPLQEIVAQLRSCNYECVAGALTNNAAWHELERMAQQGGDQ